MNEPFRAEVAARADSQARRRIDPYRVMLGPSAAGGLRRLDEQLTHAPVQYHVASGPRHGRRGSLCCCSAPCSGWPRRRMGPAATPTFPGFGQLALRAIAGRWGRRDIESAAVMR